MPPLHRIGDRRLKLGAARLDAGELRALRRAALTPAEAQVLDLVAKGLNNRAIADALEAHGAELDKVGIGAACGGAPCGV